MVRLVATADASALRSEIDLRHSMSAEAERIEGWARTWDVTYRKRAQQWSLANTVLVVLAALLAAGAGATGLGNVWGASLGPGLLALAAAAVSGVASALGASTRATQFNSSAASNSGLADAARVFRTTIVGDRPIAEVNRDFDALCKRRDTVVRSAPVSSGPVTLTDAQRAASPPGVTAPVPEPTQ